MLYPQYFIDDLKNRADLVRIIQPYAQDLKKKGVEVAIEPFEARTFWGRQGAIRDPNGYGISLREWRRGDGPYFEGWQPTSEGMVRTG